MLARRFTLVCLLAALWGMGFAALAAQTEHRPHDWQAYPATW